ncbi:hypothetical protein ACIBG0_21100 [Nocardia sp. NPDC050630]|uniref:hypothetical protein n=1 Tax=Nocardia sp. NPDC050630 TaxID=3364321 RepID=UPI003799184F
MTDPNHSAPLAPATATPIRDRWAELHGAAVNILTEAVRYEPGGEPIDFGEFLASVLETVAANVGSVARLVAGRSNSKEAAWIQGLAGGESATPEWLAPGRTAPVIVQLNLWDVLGRTGIDEPSDPTTQILHRHQRYIAAFEAAVVAEGARLGLTVPVTVRAIADPDTTPPATDKADAIADQLRDYAMEATPMILTED